MATSYKFDGTKLTKRGSSTTIATVRGDKICKGTSTSTTATIRGDKVCDGTSSTTAYTIRGDNICQKTSTSRYKKMKDVDSDIEGPGKVVKAALWLYFVN